MKNVHAFVVILMYLPLDNRRKKKYVVNTKGVAYMEFSVFTLPSVRSLRSGAVMKLRDFAVIY